MNQAEAEANVWNRAHFFCPVGSVNAPKNLREAFYITVNTGIQNGGMSRFINPVTGLEVRIKFSSVVIMEDKETGHQHDFGRYVCYGESPKPLWGTPHLHEVTRWLWQNKYFPEPHKEFNI